MRAAPYVATVVASVLIVIVALIVRCSRSTGTQGPPLLESTGPHPESRTLPASITPPEGALSIGGVLSLTAGGYHTCALTQEGTLLCWGDNEQGQLGDGTTADRAVAAGVEGLDGQVAQIAGGLEHTCAILQKGELRCWGYNRHGILGDGTTTLRTEPAGIVGLESGVTSVAPGREHSCALKDGRAWCWGNNKYGEVGDGTTAALRARAVQVVGLAGNVTSIGTGWYHTCALTGAGAVWCWGNNQYGQLGNGGMGDQGIATPVAVTGLPDGVVSLVVGGAHNCVLTESGGVKCWGRNNYGQLGDGTTVDRVTPVDVVGLRSDVVAIAAGTGQTCALGRSGAVQCWGHDWYGELGDGTSGEGNIRPTPVDVQGLPGGVTAIAMGRFHTCALAGGGVWCWGRNGFGELGDGTRAQRLAPVAVLGLPD